MEEIPPKISLVRSLPEYITSLVSGNTKAKTDKYALQDVRLNCVLDISE